MQRDKESDSCWLLGPVIYISFMWLSVSVLLSSRSLVFWVPYCVVTQETQKKNRVYRVWSTISSVTGFLWLSSSKFYEVTFSGERPVPRSFPRSIILSFVNPLWTGYVGLWCPFMGPEWYENRRNPSELDTGRGRYYSVGREGMWPTIVTSGSPLGSEGRGGPSFRWCEGE